MIENLVELLPSTPSVSYTQPSFAIAAQEVAAGQVQDVTFSASGQPGSLSVSFNSTDNATAMITIPNNTLSRLNASGAVKITHALFADDRLFINSLSRERLGSVVLASSIAGGHTLRNLSDPVRIMFKKNTVGYFS